MFNRITPFQSQQSESFEMCKTFILLGLKKINN